MAYRQEEGKTLGKNVFHQRIGPRTSRMGTSVSSRNSRGIPSNKQNQLFISELFNRGSTEVASKLPSVQRKRMVRVQEESARTEGLGRVHCNQRKSSSHHLKYSVRRILSYCGTLHRPTKSVACVVGNIGCLRIRLRRRRERADTGAYINKVAGRPPIHRHCPRGRIRSDPGRRGCAHGDIYWTLPQFFRAQQRYVAPHIHCGN
jgi:hypothetical protein